MDDVIIMGKSNFRKIKGTEGFALVEVMVSAVIMILAFVGILVTYMKCMELNEMSRNKSMATKAAKTRMELINTSAFSSLTANYNNIPFLPAVRMAGVSYINTTNPDLAQIVVSVCWRQKNGLLVGEDADLDGVLDAGEDTNGNGMIDSPVQLVTFRYDE